MSEVQGTDAKGRSIDTRRPAVKDSAALLSSAVTQAHDLCEYLTSVSLNAVIEHARGLKNTPN